jgi:hypothetical protein
MGFGRVNFLERHTVAKRKDNKQEWINAKWDASRFWWETMLGHTDDEGHFDELFGEPHDEPKFNFDAFLEGTVDKKDHAKLKELAEVFYWRACRTIEESIGEVGQQIKEFLREQVDEIADQVKDTLDDSLTEMQTRVLGIMGKGGD